MLTLPCKYPGTYTLPLSLCVGNLVQLLLVLQEWRSLLTENPCAPGQLISLKATYLLPQFPQGPVAGQMLATARTFQGVPLTPKCDQVPSDSTNPSCVPQLNICRYQQL